MQGNRIKELRKKLKLTQEQLANKLNTSRSNIANYENNQNNPSLDTLFRLSDILNCSVDYLAGFSNSIKGDNDSKPEPIFYDDDTTIEYTIEQVKNNINNLSNKDMNKTGKETLIRMVDYYHDQTKKDNKNG